MLARFGASLTAIPGRCRKIKNLVENLTEEPIANMPI